MSVAGCGDIYILPPRHRVEVSFHVWLRDLEVRAKGFGKIRRGSRGLGQAVTGDGVSRGP